MNTLLIIDSAPHFVATLKDVPRMGDQVIFNHKVYLVSKVQWDLDEGDIRIYLFKT